MFALPVYQALSSPAPPPPSPDTAGKEKTCQTQTTVVGVASLGEIVFFNLFISKLSLPSFADMDDLFDVNSELQPVAARWKHFGLALRLNPDKLDEIEKDNRDSGDCLTKVLTLWLKKNYNTERFGEPSWELLARAAGNPAGGNDSALAAKIAERHGGVYTPSLNPLPLCIT